MFYVRKPEQKSVIIMRTATAEELHNYKNKFIVVDSLPETDKVDQGGYTDNLQNNCPCKDELLFINCELDINDLKLFNT